MTLFAAGNESMNGSVVGPVKLKAQKCTHNSFMLHQLPNKPITPLSTILMISLLCLC